MNALRAAAGWIRSRLANRPDSEHSQAIVRLAIACLIFTYLLLLDLFADRYIQGNTGIMLKVMFAEALIGLGLLVAILWHPGISHVRRWVGITSDYATLLTLMLLEPKGLAPLYVIVLWVTIGNGLRYGMRYLSSASVIGAASFAVVVANSTYWREQAYLSVGLVVGLVAIPAYLSRLLQSLRRSTEEARRANAAKSQFLATMSHEFRSPLNGIIGMSELLRNAQMPAEQRDHADVIYTSAQTLLLLVEEVLDISAIEAVKLQQKPVDFSVREFVAKLDKMLQPQAQGKGIALQCSVEKNVPGEVHGDSAHLTQILLNLLHNAIKFTESGTVSLAVSLVDTADGTSRVAFSVRDTGIGIPDEYKQKIFEAFEQVDSGPARRYGGTGLGTTIARTLTQLLGGVLRLEDNPGGGCHFFFDIPLTKIESKAISPGAQNNVVAFDDPFVRHKARVRSLRALIADDQQANRSVICKLLERAGHRTVAVADGEQALDMLEQNDFDFVVLDMHMPNVSGLDVIRHLRFMQAGRATRTPVIVLSADATEQAAKAALQAGAQVFLTKPVVVTKLLEAIVEVSSPQKRPVLKQISELPAIVTNSTVLEELAAMGLGGAFLKDFVEQCLRDLAGCISSLDRHASSADWGGFRDAAHAMKGVSENLGATSIAERCRLIMRSDDATLAKKHGSWTKELSAQLGLLNEHIRREAERITSGGSDAERRPAPDAS
ncbi:MAG: response regulator [Lysobacter sp.]|nr:response regulator [Lysobacter sp.]